ncbi:hypothetical protein BYT27DRAFT_7217155 [Phlegmacium glaucopus]|nr:hypothetical protein BYT27DRAFT_7217155 [Phlegmacium glaucopus]
MLIQLAPPLAKARRKRANAGVSIEKNPFNRLNDETNTKRTNSDLEELELELDVVMDISRYPMTLRRDLGLGGGNTTTELGSGKKDSIDSGLSSPACTPVPVLLPVPSPLGFSGGGESGRGIEGGGGGGGGVSVPTLEKQKEKEKIQGYYLCSSSSTSTGSPSSPFSPFERCGMETETETDPSSPDTPYPNLHSHPDTSEGSPVVSRDDACSGAINPYTHTQVRKRSSFFGWEFAWDQEALERADDAGKLRSAGAGGGGGSPAKSAKSNPYETSNPSTSDQAYSSKKNQQVGNESFMNLGGGRESFGLSYPSSGPHSLSSEVEVGEGVVKGGMSWRSSVCGVVGVGGGEEKVKRKNTLGLGIKPLRLSRSFGGTSNNNSSGSRGSGTGHRTILSGDTGPMCGLSLKRKATVLICGQGSPSTVSAVSSRAIGQGNGDATRTTIAATPTTPKRLKKKTKPGHATAGTSPSAESKIGERNQNNHSIGFIHGSNRNSDNDDEELDENGDLQKTPTMRPRTTTRSYSQSPQSYRYYPSSSPNQQRRHEVAASETRCSSINESYPTTATTTTTAATNTANTGTTDSPTKLSPSLTRRGLSLKRSFKMGSTVGRTLGPGLTLSSAGLSSIPGSGAGSSSGPPTSASAWHCAPKSVRRCESEGFRFREEVEKRECDEKEKHVEKKRKENLDDEKEKEKFGEAGEEDLDVDVDVDVEDELRSLAAARLVSVSYARATPAATILTLPDGGCVSRSGGSGNTVEYTAVQRSTLHSRPSLPIMNTIATAANSPSVPVCSTINASFSTAASRGYGRHHVWKPHPFVDWFRPSEASNRGDDEVGSLKQEMEITRALSRGNENDKLSSPPLLPPLPPPLPPMTPPSQSQSLPPTPIKSRSALLVKPSISSFKKRSAPPGSSEWALLPQPMLTVNGVGGAAASMVSLAHSRSNSASQSIVGPGQTISRPPSQPPSRPTTPRPNTRLSAMNMGTVRNAFAGVGAKVSARMSINSASTRGSAGAAAGNAVVSSMGMGMDDFDGDFMDLRDPFASPPPSKLANVFRGGDHTGGGGDFWVSERTMPSLGGAMGYDDDDDVEVGFTRRISSVSGGKRRVNMNAWGRLPMPSPTLLLLDSAPGTSSASVSSSVGSRKKAHSHHGERRKHKEKRARKAAAADNSVLGETHPPLHGYTAPPSVYNACEEDADFDVEEALLSQRLLRRLDSVEWD